MPGEGRRVVAEGGAEPAKKPVSPAACGICPHRCVLKEGQRGLCRARIARGGRVVDENYGRVAALALDPIEKKPLARFHPGARVLSVGSYGCTMRCPFCQNADIAAVGSEGAAWRFVPPDELVARALALRDDGCIGIAYTYNEPLAGFEYVHDAARLAHEAGLVNVLVSNGLVNEEPLLQLAPFIDAANIDLKGFSPSFYRRLGGSLAASRRAIELLAACPTCHVEVTTLVIPGENDDAGEVEAAAAWLASLDPDIPYHLTRFFPRHLMAHAEPTPIATLRALAAAARRHLRHVQLGNC